MNEENKFRAQYERAKARLAALPPHARPILTRSFFDSPAPPTGCHCGHPGSGCDCR